MKTRNDFTRQASLFTMNGLIDPRMLPGYEKTNVESKSTSLSFSFANNLRRVVESITGRRIKNEPA